jgi:hypothetical protein
LITSLICFGLPKSCLLPLHLSYLIILNFSIDVSVLLCVLSVSFNHTKSDAGFAAWFCKWFNQSHACTIPCGGSGDSSTSCSKILRLPSGC